MDTNNKIDRFLSSFTLWVIVACAWAVAIIK